MLSEQALAERLEVLHRHALLTLPMETLKRGTGLRITLVDGQRFVATVEQALPDWNGKLMLVTNKGTLRKHSRLAWWKRPEAGEDLACVDVDAIEQC